MNKQIKKRNQKFKGYFPNELILLVLSNIIFDLFKFDIEHKIQKNNKYHPMKIIKNILLSSKIIN